jgi:hypothetical protein
MMNYEQILQWAKRWHYPFLVLSEYEAIRHGEEHYQRLQGDPLRMYLATVRIERWNAIVGNIQSEAA